jgi:hypothetical protein
MVKIEVMLLRIAAHQLAIGQLLVVLDPTIDDVHLIVEARRRLGEQNHWLSREIEEF